MKRDCPLPVAVALSKHTTVGRAEKFPVDCGLECHVFGSQQSWDWKSLVGSHSVPFSLLCELNPWVGETRSIWKRANVKRLPGFRVNRPLSCAASSPVFLWRSGAAWRRRGIDSVGVCAGRGATIASCTPSLCTPFSSGRGVPIVFLLLAPLPLVLPGLFTPLGLLGRGA